MIRKGTPLSRFVALGLLFGPPAIGALSFLIWALAAWSDAGDRIVAAETALHRIDARRSQVELYEPLSASWTEYAGSEGSGLVIDADFDAAAEALTRRVETLFEEAEGAGVVSVIGVVEERDGLQRIDAEAGGTLPQATLPRFFSALESGEPFLFVEFLDLRRAPEDGPPMVSLRLRFSAYRITGDGSDTIARLDAALDAVGDEGRFAGDER